MTSHTSRFLPALLAPALVVGLAGCGASSAGEDDGRVSVVASTNVYGSLVQLVAGETVRVTSLIDSPAQDPHSFEASARDRLAIAEADLVILNGGGYDPFMNALLDASGTGDLVVLDAFETTGLPDGANEHVWYDLGVMAALAAEVGATLSDLAPEHAETFAANVDRLEVAFDELEATADEIAAAVGGQDAATTEPVPQYLLERAGLVDVTPEAFSEAIEEGSDVAPRDLETMLSIVASGDLVLLAYNDQTTNAQTEQVRAAAEAAGVPVVSFTETLPEGDDYLGWMRGNLAAIAAAAGL